MSLLNTKINYSGLLFMSISLANLRGPPVPNGSVSKEQLILTLY